MKFKSLLIVISFLSINISLFARPILPDSVGVKNDDGKKVILFKVKPKDTYSSIGRRYDVSPKTIMKYNDTKKETLTIGAIVKVPTSQPFKKSETKKEKSARLKLEAEEASAAKKHKHKNTDEYTPDPAPEKPVAVVTQPPVARAVQQPAPEVNITPTQYKVSAGETLYSISKRFNTTVDDITKQNNLTSTTVIPDQILSVRAGYHEPPTAPAPIVAHNDTQAIVAKRDSTLMTTSIRDSAAERRFEKNRFGLYEKTEKGVATWIDDSSLDPNKKLVLHRTALIGTVIKITNPMTNRTTFAKVVGRFTDNEQTKDVIIVMTKNVADSLGALDKRFHVNISYGSPNE
ncbi:MAG TPA: LysM peptidoglycan-binding domain-containing protein [Mucilaginibacter sp.]|jgi:LysM repeat protein